MRRIGIDVGGTNTDAVLVEGDAVRAGVKTGTTPDVLSGVLAALSELLQLVDGDDGTLDAVMIGTTQFTNAVVERRHLSKVAAVRIGLPASASLPPFVDWPADLRGHVDGHVAMVRGGYEVDGRPLVPFDAEAMRREAGVIASKGIGSVAVTSIFSPLKGEDEERAAAILRDVCGDVDITLSKDLGRIGLLGRENAALLNAAIVELARKTTNAFTRALRDAGIEAPLFLTQNDGTIALAEQAIRFPVYSFASGPTNSMRGAAFLSGRSEALVVDVGGTTSDIGCLTAGFPRQANNVVEVGGVRTLFRMPDLLSLGLGGGSLVREDGAVGPRSVGYRLTDEARVFGGTSLTATDIAVASGLMSVGDPSRVAGLDRSFVERARRTMGETLEEGVDRVKIDAAPMPLIAVGGAAPLVADRLPGVSEVVHVEHQGVANAVGAAIAQVSGEVDQVFSGIGRDDALAEATALATARAKQAGAAEDSLAVVELEDLPIAYLPGDARRVRVRVVGDAGKVLRD